jgi:TonB family protein
MNLIACLHSEGPIANQSLILRTGRDNLSQFHGKGRHYSVKSGVVAFLLFAATALPNAQQPNPGPATTGAATQQFEDGTVSNGAYSNECLGFSFRVPAGWEIPYQQGTQARARHIPGGLGLLLIRQQTTGSNAVWLLARENVTFGGNTEQLVSKLVQDYVNASPATRSLLGDAYPVKYGGQQFFRRDYKRSLQGGDTSYMAFVLTNFRGFFLGGSLVAGSEEDLNKEAEFFREVSFQKDEVNSRCSMGSDGTPPPGGVIRGVISSKPVSSPPGWLPSRVRVSQKVSQALLISKVDPQYPQNAKQKHIEGVVLLTAVIDARGDVQDLTLASGDPLLASAATEAVKQWKYKPYLLSGEPTNMETQISVSFTLEQH